MKKLIVTSYSSQKGAALVATLLLMLILVMLGQAMVYLSGDSSRKEAKSRISESALYIAEAGVEDAVKRLTDGTSASFAGTVGGATGKVAGVYDVVITDLGSNQYRIDSTGYLPSTETYRARRRIETEVSFAVSEPYTDGIAIRTKGAIDIDQSVTIKGGLWSNDVITIGDGVTITDSSAGAGDGSIQSAYSGADSVVFDGNASMTGTDPYIRANQTVFGEENVTGSPTVVEYAGLTPIPDASFPAFNANTLLDGSQVVHAAYTTYGPGQTLSLDDTNGRVHEFQAGVYFDSGSVLTGTGTIIVTGGSGDYAIEIDQGMGSEDYYVPVNICVTGGTWSVSDIYFDKDCYFAGAMVGDYDINVDQSVHIKGVIDCGGSVSVDQDITIEYAAPVYSMPGGGTGDVSMLSWQEIKP